MKKRVHFLRLHILRAVSNLSTPFFPSHVLTTAFTRLTPPGRIQTAPPEETFSSTVSKSDLNVPVTTRHSDSNYTAVQFSILLNYSERLGIQQAWREWKTLWKRCPVRFPSMGKMIPSQRFHSGPCGCQRWPSPSPLSLDYLVSHPHFPITGSSKYELAF